VKEIRNYFDLEYPCAQTLEIYHLPNSVYHVLELPLIGLVPKDASASDQTKHLLDDQILGLEPSYHLGKVKNNILLLLRT
jgi:hypothetical protein